MFSPSNGTVAPNLLIEKSQSYQNKNEVILSIYDHDIAEKDIAQYAFKCDMFILGCMQIPR